MEMNTMSFGLAAIIVVAGLTIFALAINYFVYGVVGIPPA